MVSGLLFQHIIKENSRIIRSGLSEASPSALFPLLGAFHETYRSSLFRDLAFFPCWELFTESLPSITFFRGLVFPSAMEDFDEEDFLDDNAVVMPMDPPQFSSRGAVVLPSQHIQLCCTVQPVLTIMFIVCFIIIFVFDIS